MNTEQNHRNKSVVCAFTLWKESKEGHKHMWPKPHIQVHVHVLVCSSCSWGCLFVRSLLPAQRSMAASLERGPLDHPRFIMIHETHQDETCSRETVENIITFTRDECRYLCVYIGKILTYF